ncbi:MAG: 30S ribosome-binding factor RbfA [Candidatus Wildermuthbacteria bacterium]|nr:30S ribosome-binding factor RbfA [Candidatus Wildermuthbacteria bacterium]
MENKRTLRLQALLQREIGEIFLRELEFPGQTFVTITNVSATPDLQHAQIHISVIPDAKEKEVWNILQGSIFQIQQILNKKLRMHPVPKIEWVKADVSSVQKVEQLFEQI